MRAMVGQCLPHTMPTEAFLSPSKSSSCGFLETSGRNSKFSVPKRKSWRIRDSPAGERARPRSVGVRCGFMFDSDENLHEQAAAEQVTESTEWSRWSVTRRSLLALPLGAATLPVSPSFAAVKVENRAPNENSLLRTFGIGDPDIFYPRFFAGTWNCYSTLIALETPQGDDKVDLESVNQSRKRLGYTTSYQARFLPFEGYVICDRLFTTVSLVQSIIGKNTVDHGSWNPRQPNRLQLVLKGGGKVENTVTKRSSGMFSPYEFESAEFSKQVLDNFSAKDGPPTVKASQNLTRYQWDIAADDVSKIEAIQKVSMYAVPKEGGQNFGLEIFNSTSPITIYKYKLTFERQGP